MIEPALPAVLDALYHHILQWPALKALFATPERIKFARDRQLLHWQHLFAATYDETYIASVKRIALTHARIGLDPKYYICAYLVALEELHAVVLHALLGRFATRSRRAQVETALRAIDRAILFDLQLVVEGYLEAKNQDYRGRLDDLAVQFETVITGFADGVTAAAHGLNDAAGNLNTSADTASIGEITRQMQQAASTTHRAVETVGRASGIVEQLSAATNGIAAAVEEQGAVTQEISRSVASAAEGSGAITEGARQVRGVAGETADHASKFGAASRALIERSDRLLAETKVFIDRIRTADRRTETREKINHPVTVLAVTIPAGTIPAGTIPAGTNAIAGTLNDVSPGGAAVLIDAREIPPGVMEVVLKASGAPFELKARSVDRTSSRINLTFTDAALGAKLHHWFVATAAKKAA